MGEHEGGGNGTAEGGRPARPELNIVRRLGDCVEKLELEPVPHQRVLMMLVDGLGVLAMMAGMGTDKMRVMVEAHVERVERVLGIRKVGAKEQESVR